LSAQAFVFFLTAAIAVLSAVMVIIVDNPVRSVLWLILNMVCLLYTSRCV